MATTTIANSSAATKAEIRALIGHIDGVATGNTGAVNAIALQAAIDVGDPVMLSRSGVYEIADTLIATRGINEINLGTDVEIKQTVGTGKTLFETVAVDTTPATVTSITASGNVATVTITSHGYSVDEYIFIYGSNVDGYNGVFKVQTVPTADTLTVKLPYAPIVTTAAGTIKALPGTEKVTLTGGKWNYDNDNNNSSGGTNAHMIILAGVRNVVIRDIELLHAEKYALYLAGCQHITIDNVQFDTDSDGFHILGPVYYADIRKTRGRTEDNMVALATNEGSWGGILPYSGTLNNVTIDGLYPENSVGGVIRVLGAHEGTALTITSITKSVSTATVTTSTDHGLLPRDVVKFDTIAGMTQMSGRVMQVGRIISSTQFRLLDVDTSGYGTFSSGTVQKVSHYKIKNLQLSNLKYAQDDTGSVQPLFQALVETNDLNAVIIDNLTIDGIVADDSFKGRLLSLNAANPGAMYIDNITFKSVVVDLPPGGSVGDYVVVYINKGSGDTYGQLINDLNFVNCKIRGYSENNNHRCIYVTGAGQIKRTHFTDSVISGLHSCFHANSAGIIDGYELFITNVAVLDGAQLASSGGCKMTIYANGVRGHAMYYGITRTNVTSWTHTVYGNNINWQYVDPMDTVGGTGNIRAVGLGIRTVAANLTPQTGDYVFDTADNRPEVWNGSAWVAM
ncbi:MAG: hypothetical protein KIS69_10325 [Bacteroidetes bacterium]|nr:hypothetical protein [Bacteroidota bacterium]